MRRLCVIVVVLALALPAVAPPAEGQLIVYDPASFVQMLVEYLQMLADYYQQFQNLESQYRQIQQLGEQYEAMLQDLEDLDDVRSDNPSRFLRDLRAIFVRLEGVVYAADDVLRRWDEVFRPEPTYELSRREAERMGATMTTLRTLMAGAQEHAEASEASGVVLGRLLEQLDDAEGNLEALQALGAITTAVATETTRVSEVEALAVNALVVREANELAREEEARLTLRDWMRRGELYRRSAPRAFRPVPPGFSGGAP